jgi:hypothetical protein
LSKTLKALKRQEGNGAGNSVRLRGRKKALEGDPKSGSGMKQGRAGSGRMKAPGGCENLKAQAVGMAFPTNSCRCPKLGRR